MKKKPYQTAGRALLISYLKEQTGQAPLDADRICEGLCRLPNAPAKSSVYRMLSELSASGEVRRFRAEDGGERATYQYVGSEGGCASHLHLQCRSCGLILHLRCDCSREIRAQLLASHGFLVDEGRSVLYGTCAACAEGGAR
ncbi:MAG: transcriptional repressor [Ruminococcaceae bacterium]|nr:transcriptional repressor [Oscillospiraceae bacterium]